MPPLKPDRPHRALYSDDLVSEDQVALIFQERQSGKFLYCRSSGIWYVYTGESWTPDRLGLVIHLVRELARELAHSQMKDTTRVTAGKANFIYGSERLSRSDPTFAATSDVFDQDPWLLGTPRGTVNLRSGLMRPADPSDRITKLTSIVPAPASNCPRWLTFLNQATCSDAGLIRFVQQWCGYSLTGSTREHALVFVYGPGGNGKSVFLNVLTGILGEYAKVAAMDTFTASTGDKHSTDMAMLRGARLVTASETDEGRAWDEAKIKQLTGGDPVTARFMRQDFFTFTPAFKLTIAGNHQPMLRNVDEAAKRRFNIVPFIRKPEKPDLELEGKLKAEWPAILRWMIEGCLDWQQNGLLRPASVVDATDAYFAEQDLMAQWLAEKCDVRQGDASVWDRTSDLFQSWTAYARAAGDVPGTTKSFGPAMLRHGLMPYRTNSARGFQGVRLKYPPNPERDA
jgi:putative DNA primase/helicase